jgi:hypothetical protein
MKCLLSCCLRQISTIAIDDTATWAESSFDGQPTWSCDSVSSSDHQSCCSSRNQIERRSTVLWRIFVAWEKMIEWSAADARDNISSRLTPRYVSNGRLGMNAKHSCALTSSFGEINQDKVEKMSNDVRNECGWPSYGLVAMCTPDHRKILISRQWMRTPLQIF